ncbi:MAG: hypothetical protein A2015_17295 [Spirochaetes bacterium GWF1_31_7]|nr:MAG: hypothetical protein A2Y30_14625 [Spirochaetes bacterium GWE1_32_154]OHD46853.1 MAG: hypothetical protein A2015_17295 [Spirochaetes bacterium GWF1_31_7]OHD50189.1 MAG: hypothetical protein A2Y29_12670 [Spirochaetes bacterium GWE2_31_10]OHD81966.1 MAG: hypothetical protein A2355_02000 [Spirochaetes bacterium RIFOXYB1_FULL_32_8]HBD94031.1 hypothetical protein [Spirochaetia bacterium]
MKRFLLYIFFSCLTAIFADDIVNIPDLSLKMNLKEFNYYQKKIKPALIDSYYKEWIYDGSITNNSDEVNYVYFKLKGSVISCVIQAIKCNDMNYNDKLEKYKAYFIESGFNQVSKPEDTVIVYRKSKTYVKLSKLTVKYDSYLLINYNNLDMAMISRLKSLIEIITSKNLLSVSFGIGYDFDNGGFALGTEYAFNSFISLNLPFSVDYFINRKIAFGGGAVAKIGLSGYLGTVIDGNICFNSKFFMRTLFARNFIPYIGIEYGTSVRYNFLSTFVDYTEFHHISPYWSFGPYVSAYFPGAHVKYASTSLGVFFEMLFGKTYYFPSGTNKNPYNDSSLVSVNVVVGMEIRLNINIKKSL